MIISNVQFCDLITVGYYRKKCSKLCEHVIVTLNVLIATKRIRI